MYKMVIKQPRRLSRVWIGGKSSSHYLKGGSHTDLNAVSFASKAYLLPWTGKIAQKLLFSVSHLFFMEEHVAWLYLAGDMGTEKSARDIWSWTVCFVQIIWNVGQNQMLAWGFFMLFR